MANPLIAAEKPDITALWAADGASTAEFRKRSAGASDAEINVRRTWATALSGRTAECIIMTSDEKKAGASIIAVPAHAQAAILIKNAASCASRRVLGSPPGSGSKPRALLCT